MSLHHYFLLVQKVGVDTKYNVTSFLMQMYNLKFILFFQNPYDILKDNNSSESLMTNKDNNSNESLMTNNWTSYSSHP